MTRERIREELIWGVATLLAALLCLALSPFVVLLSLESALAEASACRR